MTFPQFTMSYSTLANENLVDVLRLIRTLNVGPVTFFQLMRRYGTAADALAVLPDMSLRGGRRMPLAPVSKAEAEKEIYLAEKFGARMIMYGQPDYPKLLQTINDPPPVITVLGHAHLWQQKDVMVMAMVGARNASAHNCQFAGRLAKELGQAGIVISSGLARGIDTFAHKGALATGTVGVIAGGIDNVYPPENDPLYKQLRDEGAIISEQPFGAIPFSGSFPGRNRIIAGMSLGVVVVEASPKSGSLITARFANEAGREVFAVPGSPLDPRAKGCNQLIRQGAIMVESASDILSEIAHMRSLAMKELPPARYDGEMVNAPASDTEIDAMRAKILQKLSIMPVSVDELVEQCETSAAIVLTVVLELELAGRLKRHPGNKVSLMGQMQEEVA